MKYIMALTIGVVVFTSAYSSVKCSKWTLSSTKLDVQQHNYKIYTEDSSGATYTSEGFDGQSYTSSSYGSLVFPAELQGKSTKFKLRPRNNNCTCGSYDTVYDKNHNYVLLSDDPKCHTGDKGHWSYTVPTAEKISSSTTTTMVNGESVPYLTKGYGVLGTSHGCLSGDPNYKPYAIYMIYPYDKKKTTVYIAELCM